LEKIKKDGFILYKEIKKNAIYYPTTQKELSTPLRDFIASRCFSTRPDIPPTGLLKE
jgi:hypothetical protein